MAQFTVENYLSLQGNENAYTSQLLEDFYFLIEHEHFHQALNVYHLLFMTVIYQTILKAREWRKQKFKDATILIYNRYITRDQMLETNLAFDFSRIAERTFMEYLKLFDANPELVKECKELVKERNERSHANGYYFSDELLFEEMTAKYDTIFAQIHSLYNKYLMKVLEKFLDGLGRGADVTRNDLEFDLILPHKLSLSDLASLREIATLRRKAHRQIREILAEDYDIYK